MFIPKPLITADRLFTAVSRTESDVCHNARELADFNIGIGADRSTDKKMATLAQQMAALARRNYFLAVDDRRAALRSRH
jgi:hypothetical protein